MLRILLFSIIFLLSTGCQEQPKNLPEWQEITGRDEGVPSTREPIYRARVPSHWVRINPNLSASNSNTTLPIITFFINSVEIHVHNFPYDQLEKRIPPEAQVARWQRQIKDKDAGSELVTPYGHGGFAGLRFEAIGTLKEKPDQMVVAYALQLSPEHFQMLLRPPSSAKKRQQRSDYTIKITGPVDQVLRHREEIERFSRSFELIEEVPSR